MRKQGCKKWALYVPQLVALLLVFNLNLNATAFSQHQRLNLKLKDATLEEFISAIKRQCDVGFIYDYNIGFAVSAASLVQSAFLAVALIIVGAVLYREAIKANKVIGIVICLIGLYFINK